MDAAERDLLEARFRVGELPTADLHDLADDLLARGEEAEELVALYRRRRSYPGRDAAAIESDVRDLARRTLERPS